MKLSLNKTVAAVASSALLLMAVPALGLASTANAAGVTFSIGYEGPLTGANAQLGINMQYGVQLAINHANSAANAPFTLKLVNLDDQGSGTLSPAQAQAAVADPSMVAVVGPAFSGATRAAEPYYSAANMATVSPSATAAALAHGSNNNFMRVVAGDDVQGAADANFLVKKMHFKKIYVLNDASFYGAGLAAVVAKQVKADRAKSVTATYQASSSCGGTASVAQYRAAATQIKASKATAVFYGGYYCDLGLILGALHSAGYKGAVMSGDGSLDPALIKGTTPKTAANGVYLSVAGGGSAFLTGTLATEYQAQTGAPSAATATYAAQAYDATNMIIAALTSVYSGGATTVSAIRPALVTALHGLTFTGVTGQIKFQSNGDLVRSSVVDFSRVIKGKIKSIGHS
jgi:branched-chain amino acid transport system substrate-binding protein